MESDPSPASPRPGAVVIGRDEGERIERCIRSVLAQTRRAVYVDSASSDDSVARAERLEIEVIRLPGEGPLSAARARNVGFDALRSRYPDLDHVQFIDGDCELAADWIEHALAHLRSSPDVAAVFGRLREKHPSASVYHRLAQMEWDAPPGDVQSVGGIFMVCASCFSQVGGFNPDVLAGEEPELSRRLRGLGKRIVRIDAEMGTHDIAMTRFRDWWKRAARGGHAYALRVRHDPDRLDRQARRSIRSTLAWGLVLPTATVVAGLLTHGWGFVAFSAYPLQALRIALGRRRQYRNRWGDALLYGGFCVLAKFAQVCGLFRSR